jgi:LysR family transcriptional regulator, glycine cleavage system transcriptional activator
MRKLPPLNAVRAFEAVARNRSFSAAAQELCVTTTAISHQVRHIEELLGVRLLDRTSRSIRLTPAGERIFPLLQEGLDRLADAFSGVDEHKSGSAITVATTRAFAERWLLPRLPHFRASHSELIVNVEASEDLVDLRTSGVDLAIRYGQGREAGLENFVLFEDRYVPVISAACSECNHAPIDTFRSMQLLAFRWKNPALGGPTWSAWFSEAKIAQESEFRINWFSEENLALQALDHGYGPLIASDVLIGSGLATGAYHQILGPSLPGLVFSVLLAPTAGRKRSVQAFCAWLREQAALTPRIT